MKQWQFVLLTTMGVVCLCLSLVVIVLAQRNRQLQEAVQAQQAIINKGALSQQVSASLVRELTVIAQTDEKVRELLNASGYTSSLSPTAASPAP